MTEKIDKVKLKNILKKHISDKIVLDIGCAGNAAETGKWPKPDTWLHSYVAGLSKECIGIDIDWKELSLIKKNLPNLKLVSMSGDAFYFKKKFDCIVINWCLSCLNQYKTLDCARELLNEGGKIIIGVSNPSNITNFFRILANTRPYYGTDYKFLYDPFLLMNFLTSQGFRITNKYWAERRKYPFLEKLFIKFNDYFRQYFLVIAVPEKRKN